MITFRKYIERQFKKITSQKIDPKQQAFGVAFLVHPNATEPNWRVPFGWKIEKRFQNRRGLLEAIDAAKDGVLMAYEDSLGKAKGKRKRFVLTHGIPTMFWMNVPWTKGGL